MQVGQIGIQQGQSRIDVQSLTFNLVYVQQGFHQVWYQGGVKATVFGVFEDLNFKISEGLDQN